MERRLTFAVHDSLSELKKSGTGKREARETYHQELRKKARENGLSEEKMSQLPYYSSSYIHSYNTYYQYLGICTDYAQWLAETHTDVQRLAYAFRKRYAKVAELCRMTGVHEVELEHLYPECFIMQSDGSLVLHLDGGNQHTKSKKTIAAQ